VEGVVVLRVIISITGKVKSMQVISGPQMLIGSAIYAVDQWKYKPYLLNGQPTEVETTISVSYSLKDAPPLKPGNAVSSGAGSPQEYGGVPVRKIGGGVTEPELIYHVEPEFSAEAKKAKFNGIVLVNLIVDSKGKPQDVRVLRGVGMGLDEKALKAVRAYRFRPATEYGKPVPVGLNVEVNFKIF
jgi:TonB family protein